MTAIQGVIFDLDGTLVDSRLDFDLMRKDLGIAGRQPVLEHVENLAEGEAKNQAWEVLLRHEIQGAETAILMPGVDVLLAEVARLELRCGILTRNARVPTELALSRLGLTQFDPVLTREDAPPKPDPKGLFLIAEAWGCEPEQLLFVGDFRHDILAGRRAGMKTVLYAPKERPAYADEADLTIRCFLDFSRQLARAATGSTLESDY